MTCPVLRYDDDLVHVIWMNGMSRVKELSEDKALMLCSIMPDSLRPRGLDCVPPGPSVHEILQEGTLEWVAISSSRGPSQPRDQTQVSCIRNCEFFITEPPASPKSAYLSLVSIFIRFFFLENTYYRRNL